VGPGSLAVAAPVGSVAAGGGDGGGGGGEGGGPGEPFGVAGGGDSSTGSQFASTEARTKSRGEITASFMATP
jgi:hypothetical protein